MTAQTSVSQGLAASGIEQGGSGVNLYNGILNFNLPLLQISGRGSAGMTVPLKINNSQWQVERIPGDGGDPEIYNIYGLNYHSPIIGGGGGTPPMWGVNPNLWGGSPSANYGPGFLRAKFIQLRAGLVSQRKGVLVINFIAPDGSVYELRDTLKNGQSIAANASDRTRGTTFVSADGSSVTFVSSISLSDSDYTEGMKPTGYMMFNDGTRYDIVDGKVMSIRDRNGNRLTFTYYSTASGLDSVNPVHTITDSLGRVVSFTYADVPNNVMYDEIKYDGFGGADRTIKVWYDYLQNRLRQTRTGDQANTKTYGYLFPEVYNFGYPDGSENTMHNPLVFSRVELPDGIPILRKYYQFYYNVYGELARVETPAGGAVEYDYIAGSGVYQDYIGFQIHRAVTKQRSYPDGTTLETETIYTPTYNPVYSGSTVVDFTTDVVVEQKAAGGTLLGKSKHTFWGSPVNSLFKAPIAYKGWKEGKEKEVTVYAADGTTPLRQTINEFQQCSSDCTLSIAWWTPSGTQTSDHAPENSPRLVSVETKLLDITPNLVTKQTYSYDKYNNQTDVYEYDFGNNAVGSLLRRTHTDYLTTNLVNTTDYTSNDIHIRSLPEKVWVSPDGNENNKVSLVEYEYDNYTNGGYHAALKERDDITGSCILRDTSGSCTTLSTPSYTTRGNMTSLTFYANAANQTGPITVASQYDVAGNIIKAIDGKTIANNLLCGSLLCGTTINYTDRFGTPDGEARTNPSSPLTNQQTYSFVTSVTNPLDFTTYTQYDYSSGKSVDSEDINGVVSSAFYDDVLDRQKKVIAANNITSLRSQTITDYNDAELTVTVRSDLRRFDDRLLKSQSVIDGFGRTIESRSYETETNYVVTENVPFILLQDPQTNGWVAASKVSNPYRSYQSEQPVWTTSYTDSLGRVTSVVTPDNAILKKSYVGNQTTITDQAGRKRSGINDALGRTIKVIEDPNGTLNYETTYTFDASNNLRMTTQGQNVQEQQKRYFYYDSLGRLLRSKNPEQDTNTSLLSLTDPITGNSQWANSFIYDENDNISESRDARNILTTNIYDKLNRPIMHTYSDGTPQVNYYYEDQMLPAGVPQFDRGFSKGHLVAVLYGGAYSKDGSYYGYNIAGQTVRSMQVTEGLGIDARMNYTYTLSGSLETETYPSGRVVTNTIDDVGRLSSVTSQETNQPVKTYLNNIAYTSAGGIKHLRLGNGRWESFQYNDRLQVKQIGLGASIGSTSLLKIDYSYGSTDNNGGLRQQTITIPGIANSLVQTYIYDEINRLKSAEEMMGGVQSWKQTFNYDRFGNRTFNTEVEEGSNPQRLKTTTLPANFNVNIYNPSISKAKNRFNAGQGYEYDLAGNIIQNAEDKTFVYDANNQQTEAKTTSTGDTVARYVYDGNGKRVKKIVGSVQTFFVYDASGQLVAEYQTNYQPGNVRTSYLTADHLGSPRAITDSAGIVKSRHDYMAFGEEIQAGVGGRSPLQYVDDSIRKQYTGYERDDETGLDYAQARYYNQQQGRFTSVDPLMASATIKNPQTFNRYSYVLNNPYNLTDPLGLAPGVSQAEPYWSGTEKLNHRWMMVYGGDKSAWDQLTPNEQKLIDKKIKKETIGTGKNARTETAQEAFERMLNKYNLGGLAAAENVVAGVRNMLDITGARSDGPIWNQIDKIVGIVGGGDPTTTAIDFQFTVDKSSGFRDTLKANGYVENMKIAGYDETQLIGDHRWSMRYQTESNVPSVPHFVQQTYYDENRFDLHFDPANSACTKCSYGEQVGAGLAHLTVHRSASATRKLLQQQSKPQPGMIWGEYPAMTKLPITFP